MTLRLALTIATEVGCDDPDGPGHAPRYLDVRQFMINCNNVNAAPSIQSIAVMVKTYNAIQGQILEIIPGRECEVRIDDKPAWRFPEVLYNPIVTIIKTEMGMNQYVYELDRTGSFEVLLENEILYFHATVAGNDAGITITRQPQLDIIDRNQMIGKLPN